MAELLGHALGFYVALGMMLVGFAYMFAGKAGGARAAQSYFGGTLRSARAAAQGLCSAVLTKAWAVFVLLIMTPLRAVVSWLARRERGWLRHHRTQETRIDRHSHRLALQRMRDAVAMFVRRHISLHSLPFLLTLFSVVVMVFLLCIF